MRTINRPPASVGIPDVDYKYFNHYNWKGLNTNKNYYDLDPETFESAENIYVDEKGILKSRPSLHPLDKNLTNIIKSWSFGHVQVYLTDAELDESDNYFYRLHFLNDNSIDTFIVNNTDIVLAYDDDKIFIFNDSSFRYYDIVSKECLDAENFKYIPITKRINDNVISKGESPNLLSDYERFLYIYNKKYNPLNFSELIGNSIIAEYKQNEIVIDNFSLNHLFVFTNEKCDTSDYLAPANYDNDLNNPAYVNFLKLYKPNRPLISVSDKNTYLFCKAIANNSNNYDYQIFYSVDGRQLNYIDTVSGGVLEPKISKDGIYACVLKEDGPYFLSLIESKEGVKKYTDWHKTEVIYYPAQSDVPDSRFWEQHPINSYDDTTLTKKLVINAEFLNDEDYVIVYGSGDPTIEDESVYNDAKIVVSKNSTYTLTHLSNIDFSVLGNNRLQNPKIVNNRPHVIAYKHLDGVISYSIELTANYNFESGDYRLLLYSFGGNFNNDILENNYVSFGSNAISAIDYTSVNFSDDNDKIMYRFRGTHFQKLKYVSGSTSDLGSKSTPFSFYSRYTYNFKNSFISVDTENLKNIAYTIDSELYDFILFDAEYNVFLLQNSERVINYISNDILYNSDVNDDIDLYKIVRSFDNSFKISDIQKAKQYFAKNNNLLYVGENRYDKNNNFKWYFPKDNIESFSDKISAIKAISNSQVAIFLPNEMWYTEDTENGVTLNKSKITLGCNIDDEVISSFDGKYTIFPSKRGLVALSYQDFVASTDQTITYLSDAILPEFVKFRNNGAVKMFLYKYWLFCYHNTDGQIYILDFRNNSWWYWQLPSAVLDVAEINDEPELIINGKCYGFDHGSENYFDYILENKMPINWHLTSQKLNLGTLNNYKHIINLTLNAIQESDDPMYLTLSLANYRDTATKIDGKVLEYQVDVLKTFVKRLNYYKVNHFQYKLENTNNIALQIPLSIDNVSIKYKVTGQVR